MRALVRAWVQETQGQGIRVNMLSPGATETPSRPLHQRRSVGRSEEGVCRGDPARCIGRVAELANAAYFLASDEGSYVNGIDLQVDGGLAQV